MQNMSSPESLISIIIKYVLKWSVFFIPLLWWTSNNPSYTWLWLPSIVLFLFGLIAIYASKKIGDKIVDRIEEKLEEKIQQDKE